MRLPDRIDLKDETCRGEVSDIAVAGTNDCLASSASELYQHKVDEETVKRSDIRYQSRDVLEFPNDHSPPVESEEYTSLHHGKSQFSSSPLENAILSGDKSHIIPIQSSAFSNHTEWESSFQPISNKRYFTSPNISPTISEITMTTQLYKIPSEGKLRKTRLVEIPISSESHVEYGYDEEVSALLYDDFLSCDTSRSLSPIYFTPQPSCNFSNKISPI